MIGNKNWELIQAIKKTQLLWGGGEESIDFNQPMEDLLTYVFTKGEYSKYADVPEADKEGYIEGFRRATLTYSINDAQEDMLYVSEYEHVEIALNGTFLYTTPPV